MSATLESYMSRMSKLCAKWRGESGWITLARFNGRYQIRFDGVIRNIDPSSHRAGRILRSRVTKLGYIAVCLGGPDLRINTHVHRLVAEAFLGPCPDGKEVNHKDGNKTNNHFSNLEYVTRSENVKHGYDLGLLKPNTAKINSKIAREIRDCASRGVPRRELRRRFGLSQTTIQNIVTGATWKRA